jgi:DNA-binding MarR family transcriptional regulator
MDYFTGVYNLDTTAKILELDNDVQRLLRTGWPESWLQINLPLGSTRALLVLEGGYANTPKEIADLLNVGRTTVTGILDRLEAEQLITRSIDPADRRSFILDLTEKGHELVRQIDDVRQEQLGRALALMDTASVEALYKGMESLAEAMRICYKNSAKAFKKESKEDSET